MGLNWIIFSLSAHWKLVLGCWCKAHHIIWTVSKFCSQICFDFVNLWYFTKGSLQKKNCRFWDIVSISFTLPPLKPNWDIFNWDIFSLIWPLPPVTAIETLFFLKYKEHCCFSQKSPIWVSFIQKVQRFPPWIYILETEFVKILHEYLINILLNFKRR